MNDTYPIFHTTISAKELRPNMPPVPFLLSAASFLTQNSKGRCSLRKPRYLPASMVRGADCGGFTAAMRWGGHYRFTRDQYYTDPGRIDDDEETDRVNAFRVGIGSLCRRSPSFILEVITRIQAIIGADIPLHVWAGKLKLLQSGIALPGVISCDTGAWNGLFGYEHEKRRASGLTVVEYSWQVKHPAYMRKVARAQQYPQQQGLDWIDVFRAGPFPDPMQLMEQRTDF